jgi:hypothetical protein
VKVEFLVANDDHWWDTVTVEVPLDSFDREAMVSWFEANLLGTARYRDTVCVQVYSVPEETEEPNQE